MRIGLLGGLKVLDDEGRDVVVAGPKLRALLAVLALQPGRVVSAEQLIDALWGENPPTEVRNGLQGLASKLRRTLGSADLVAMRGAGYALELAADAVDVHRFEDLVVEAQAAAVDGDPNRAAALLAEADALWRGDPLADFVYDDFAAARSRGCPSCAWLRSRSDSISSCSSVGIRPPSRSWRSWSRPNPCASGCADFS